MKHNINIVTSIFAPILLILTFVVTSAPKVNASEDVDIPFQKIEHKNVERSDILKKFFNKYNSPLANHVEVFIKVADKYDMDYRLLPAISCVESTCGKFYIKNTYNTFGWGSGLIDYDSFEESIESVGEGLHKGYLSKGLTSVDKIARVYNPPNSANWASKVKYFMSQIN